VPLFDSVPGSLMTELLAVVSRIHNRLDVNAASGDKFKFMKVNELRKVLNEKGLALDGSRKTMIELLKESNEGGMKETQRWEAML